LLIHLLQSTETIKLSLSNLARSVEELKNRSTTFDASDDGDALAPDTLKTCNSIDDLEALEQRLADRQFYRNSVRICKTVEC
jgi:hypothetical protein